MVDALCNKLTLKIRTKMPEIDDERAEVINYGLQLMIGEIPKTLIILLIAYVLGVFKLSLLVLLIVTPYRAVSGGAHFTTHITCILATSLFYVGNALISQYLVLEKSVQYILTIITFIFGIYAITRYAPADTVAVPILRKKERKIKKILSYIIMSFMLISSLLIKNIVVSNILLIAAFLQTFALTRVMYKISHNKYGYEEYIKNNEQLV